MFTIGAFSRLAQLSIRVLRHYDELGLLKPAHTSSETGYRYYSAQQLADVNRIVALKDLGLGLEQIQRLMHEDHSVDAIASMLQLEKLRAERERDDAERRLLDLDRRLAELTDLGRLSDVDIVEKSVAALPFLSYRTTVADFDAAYALMHEVVACCKAHELGSPLLGVAHDAFFDTEKLDIELGYAVGTLESVALGNGRMMRVRELPTVDRMLSVIYVGTQADGHRRTHNALAIWLERHRCAIAGPGRELIHGSISDPNQTIEIQYPIEPAVD